MRRRSTILVLPCALRHGVVSFLLALFACAGCSSRPTEHPYILRDVPAVSDPQFRRTLNSLLGPPIVDGNQVTTLLNGDAIFPAMLGAIRSAKSSINFETFVYWSGHAGGEFASALCERARSGVKVYVMIDSVGSNKIGLKYVAQMRDAGVRIVRYHPLRWYNLDFYSTARKLNNRTHRKLLIVDGQTGFTGGVGIADEWLGNADAKDHLRDTHYKIEGPAVAQLQAAFADNWMEATGQVLLGETYFPALEKAGDQAAQVFKSSPDAGSESMELMYLLSLNAARQNIRIESAYFVPNGQTIDALVQARRRGVAVQIVVPGKEIDMKSVRKASRARWGALLRAGVEIHEFQPTMIHCKLMVIDGGLVSIGSANFDNLSFRLNDEANLNVMDKQFAQEQIKVFADDLSRSRRITLEEWKSRPVWEKLSEFTATLFGGQM